MAQKRGKKTLYTVVAVIAALLLIVATILVARALSNSSSQGTDTTTSTEETESAAPASTSESGATDVPKDASDVVAIDAAELSSIAIDPMLISVSYVKGIEGFDFQVLRNANGTKYVQFSSTKLVGTKCTNDTGVFASIIESPTSDETPTLTKTTDVDGTTYGLSLSDETCTTDAALLKQYQDAFSQPFSLLKKI